MEGSKSTPVSNGVPPLSRISYVLSNNKQTVFHHIAKLFRLSLAFNLVEFGEGRGRGEGEKYS